MAYAFKKSVTIDHTKCGATDSTNWPLTFDTTDPSLALITSGGHVFSASGYDIAFFSDAGLTNPLAHEIQLYVGTTGHFVANVLIPTLSHTSDTVIYIAYGNDGVTVSTERVAQVWDPNFKCVMHLSNGTTLSAADSTLNQVNQVITGATPGPGQIDGGAIFNGSSEIDTGTPASNLNLSRNFTVEILFNYTGAGTGSLASMGNGGWYLRSTGNPGPLQFLKSQVVGILTGATNVSTNTWHYASISVDGSGNCDLMLDATVDASGTTAQTFSSVNHCFLATEITGGGTHNERLTGSEDEFRFSSIARSQDWRKATANNLLHPNTFYTLGTETAVPMNAVSPFSDHLGPLGFLGIPPSTFYGRIEFMRRNLGFLRASQISAEAWLRNSAPATGIRDFRGQIGPVGFLGVPPSTFSAAVTFGTFNPTPQLPIGPSSIPDDRYGLGPVGLLGIPVRKFRERQEEFATFDPGAHPSIGNNVLPDDRFGLGPVGLLGIPPRKFREGGFSEPFGPSPVGPKYYPIQISQLSVEVWMRSPGPNVLWVTQTSVEAWLVNPPTAVASIPAFLWVD